MNISKWILVAFLAIGAIGLASAALAEPNTSGQLEVLSSIRAGGSGGWDYITVDPRTNRLFVARTDRVMVFDADKGKLLGEVSGINGGHGIALAPAENQGFATSGKDGMVVVFDLSTFKTVRKIKAGTKPDAILYDPASQKIFAFNHGGGDVTIIDPSALDKTPASLMVGGKLEFGVADGAGHVYVNVEDKSEVVAIDSKKQQVLAHWSVAPGTEPTGLAIDVAHRRLFVGCAGNQKLVILDADGGKVLGSVPIGAGVDGVAFDPQWNLAMSANGRDATLTAVGENAAGHFEAVQTLKTAKGAKTIALNPTTHRVYLPGMIPAGEKKTGEFGVVVVGKGAEK
ncbi:MAG: YncE family protein [Planctomycetia bacterium]|nr:YncE family protein [Planctomycetia bacterium]